MTEIYYEVIRLFFILGSLLTLAVGLILIFRPQWIESFNQRSNTWYTPRQRTKSLDIMRETDPIFYRNHTLTGWIMLVASVLGLYLIISRFPTDPFDAISTLSPEWQLLLNIVNEFLKWFFLVFIFAGLPVWVLMIFSPTQLQKVSKFFNRWISTRNMTRPLEQMNTSLDDTVLKRPKIFGSVFMVAAVFIFWFFIRL